MYWAWKFKCLCDHYKEFLAVPTDLHIRARQSIRNNTSFHIWSWTISAIWIVLFGHYVITCTKRSGERGLRTSTITMSGLHGICDLLNSGDYCELIVSYACDFSLKNG